jgi:hypothetical protein
MKNENFKWKELEKIINIKLLEINLNSKKVEIIASEEAASNPNSIVDDHQKKEDKINLIIPINTNILTNEEILLKRNSNENEKNTPDNSEKKNNKNNSIQFNQNDNSSTLYEKKKRNHLEMINSSSLNKHIPEFEISNQQSNLNKNKKFKFPNKSNNLPIIDPEKKIFSTWSIEKLEDELKKLKKNCEELETALKSEEKKKIELEKFTKLKNKWLRISQDAIYQIIEIHPQNHNYEKNTIKRILNHFRVNSETIEYDSDNDCFKE